jgi:4-amino-4-deoxy-L-arabinose transferase-like glycosyltransferase
LKLTNQLYFILSALLAAVGCFLLFVSLKHGIGISPDSVAYIKAASQFRHGGGLASFPNHWPPLYPLMLSALGLFSIDELSVFKLFHSALYGLNIFLIPYLCIPKSDNQNIVRLLFSLFLLASPQFFLVHQMAWSESPFLTLCFSGLAILHNSPNSTKTIYISAGLLGLAMLTRYIGIYFIAMGALALLIIADGEIYQRLKKSIFYGALAISPSLIYGLFNSLTLGSSTNRSINFHPISVDKVNSLGTLIINWFAPQGHHGIGLLLVIVAGFIFLIAHIKRPNLVAKSSRLDLHKSWYFLVLAVGYIIFIFISISFFDAYTPIDERIFLPCYIALWAAIFCLLGTNFKPVLLITLVLVVAIGASNMLSASKLISNSIQNGIGYLARGNDSFPILDSAQKFSGSRKVYSNAHDFLFIHRGINAMPLPRVYSPVSLKQNPEFQQALDEISNDIRSGNAIIVYMYGFIWREYYPEYDVLIAESQLQPVYFQKDGLIISLPAE